MKNNNKILLISNFENTQLYHKIFYKNFNNENLYWFVVNNKNFKFLKKYYDHKKIIYFNKKNFLDYDIEDKLSEDIKLNELLWADRVLKINENNFDYLKNIASYLYKFLKENEINFIFGEFTWSYEIVISRVANLLNIPYYNMQSTRFPSNRFLFFSNEKQDLFYLRKNPESKILYHEKENKYQKYIIKKNADKNKLKFIIKKVFKIFTDDYFDGNDPTHLSKFGRAKNFIFKIINKIGFHFISKIKTKDLNSKNYVIYYLQKNPEATVDVKGMYYSDQLNNIINIWKILPKDFMLVVKEHPNCIGDRSILFYKNFLKLRNTCIIKNSDLLQENKNEKFIKNSLATFSIASTASLQSSLNKVPSFTFAETFFSCLKYSSKLSLEDLRNSKNLENLIENKLNDSDKNNNFYLENSFEGYIVDEYLNDQINLGKIQAAILEVMSEK